VTVLENIKAHVKTEGKCDDLAYDLQELEKRFAKMPVAAAPSTGSNIDFDVKAFWLRYKGDLDLKANKSDLEHTRTDFGMWFKKIREELANKLNREDLQGFEQRLIEILQQTFADKAMNDKDHRKFSK